VTQAGTRPRGRGRPCCWLCAAVPYDEVKRPNVVLCGRCPLRVVHVLGYSVAVMLSNIASHAGRKASRPAWRSEAPAAPEFTDKHQDRLSGRTTLLGSADQIVSSLLDIRQAAGMAVEFVARSHFPTLRNSDQVELM